MLHIKEFHYNKMLSKCFKEHILDEREDIHSPFADFLPALHWTFKGASIISKYFMHPA